MSENLSDLIKSISTRARGASLSLSGATESDKNNALEAIAKGLESNRKILLEENQKDLDAAAENNLSSAMIDRLQLDHERIDAMAKGIRQLIDLTDPVGEIIESKKAERTQDPQTRVPIGVIGIILNRVQM